MRSIFSCTRPALVLIVLLSLPVFCTRSRRDTRTVLDLELHEGTDMEAVPSPDGRSLALQLWSQIWILDTSTGTARLLTDVFAPPDEHWYPRWSPDSASIAYFSLRSDGGIFVVPASGGKPRQLTFQEFDSWPSWSPDGRTIAFQRFLGGQALWRVPAAGGEPERITPDKLDATQPAWSPDGEWIAFTSEGHLSVMKPDGSSVRHITKGPNDQATSWSPDSRQIFFLSTIDGELQVRSVPVGGGEPIQVISEPDLHAYAPQWMPRRDVLVYSAGGKIRTFDPKTRAQGTIPFTARMRLTRESYERQAHQLPVPGQRLPVRGICSPAPSPEGGRIAFSALGSLWLRDSDGKVEQLTSGPGDVLDPAWSQDGRQLAFASNRAGDYQVWALDLTSRAIRQVTTAPGHVENPLWHPSGESIVFVQSPMPRRGKTLCVVPASGGAPRTIVPARALDICPLGWFRDDQSLVYKQLVYDSATWIPRTEIKRVRLDGSAVSWTADPPGQVEFAALSPQGDTLAYVSNGELWVRPLVSEKGTERRLIPGPTFFPAWSSDHTLVFVTAGKLVRVDGRTGQQKTLLTQLTYQIPSATESLLLRKARLLTPEPLDGLWDVLLRDGRIQSLHRTGEYAARADRTMDLEERTVIPGLLALHEHPFIGFPMEGYLYWGVTSIASAGEEGHWAIAQQEAIRSGRRQGPRIFPAGGFVVPTQFNAFPQMLRVRTSEQMDRYMDHLSGLGATQVKAFDRREPWVEAECVRAAHRRGLPVLSHFLRPASVAAGLDRKEHVYYYGLDGDIRSRFGQDSVEILRRADITVSSTLMWAFIQSTEGRARFKAALTRAEVADFLLPCQAGFLRSSMAELSTGAADYDRYLKIGMGNIAATDAAGVRIVAGTDYMELTPGLHWELELLVKAGLSPLKALQTATSTAAAVLGLKGQLGCISPGAIADLVVLETDPLEDIRNTQTIYAVIQGGRIIDRAALRTGATRK